MVHAGERSVQEEGDPGHDHDGGGPACALLQLPPVEGPEDRLQKVRKHPVMLPVKIKGRNRTPPSCDQSIRDKDVYKTHPSCDQLKIKVAIGRTRHVIS